MAVIGRASAGSMWDGTSGAYPSLASDGSYGYIPELWSSKIVENLYPASVFAAIANTDYEGEIKRYGDTINIRTTPSITISDYKVGAGMTYEVPVSAKVQMVIDIAKAFSFQVNSVDREQSDLDLVNMYSMAASEDLKSALDTTCFTKISAGVHASNKGQTAGADSGNIALGTTATALSLTNANILQKVVEMGQVLDEQNVPDTDRHLILPPWACTRVLLSELKDASLAGDGTSILRNGRLGQLDRWTVYRSRHLPSATGYTKIYGVYRPRLTWAAQVVESESMKNPSDFGDLVRGLTVAGVKVLGGGDGIVEMVATAGAIT